MVGVLRPAFIWPPALKTSPNGAIDYLFEPHGGVRGRGTIVAGRATREANDASEAAGAEARTWVRPHIPPGVMAVAWEGWAK